MSKGDSQTLRDYWTHHAHGGPTHFAGADAIAWGTDGDFDRCVALVSKHMSPEEAKGYCNLRHHDALGYWPAQHAARDKGEHVETLKSQAGAQPASQSSSDQARVAAGNGAASGEFGGGSGSSAKKPAGKKPAGKQPKPKKQGNKAAIRAKLAAVRAQIASLEKQLAAAKAAQSHANSASTTQAQPTTSASSTPAAASTSSPGSSSSSSSPSTTSVGALESKIAALRVQERSLEAQLKGYGEMDVVKGPRNVRDLPSGRFRTFAGEAQEAASALREGRMDDAAALIGSARALAGTPAERLILGRLQDSVARTQHGGGTMEPDIAKVGPHGYSHGWLHEGVEGAIKPRKGDTITGTTKDGRTVTGLHDGYGSKGRARISVPHPDEGFGQAEHTQVGGWRGATKQENSAMNAVHYRSMGRNDDGTVKTKSAPELMSDPRHGGQREAWELMRRAGV